VTARVTSACSNSRICTIISKHAIFSQNYIKGDLHKKYIYIHISLQSIAILTFLVNLHFLPNILRVQNKGGDDWWEHAARTKVVRNIHKILVRKPERKGWRHKNNKDPQEIGIEHGLK
jgi:hypothetical protein